MRVLAAVLAGVGLWSASHGPLDESVAARVILVCQYAVSLALGFGALTGKGISSLRFRRKSDRSPGRAPRI
jgi:hypothetical protein